MKKLFSGMASHSTDVSNIVRAERLGFLTINFLMSKRFKRRLERNEWIRGEKKAQNRRRLEMLLKNYIECPKDRVSLIKVSKDGVMK
jgi:hypothetical protein